MRSIAHPTSRQNEISARAARVRSTHAANMRRLRKPDPRAMRLEAHKAAPHRRAQSVAPRSSSGSTTGGTDSERGSPAFNVVRDSEGELAQRYSHEYRLNRT